MADEWNWTGYAVAAILVVAGLALVTVWDEAPNGPQEFVGDGLYEFGEEESEPGAGNEITADLSWWAGAGAVVLGVLVGVWAFWDDADEDEYEEY